MFPNSNPGTRSGHLQVAPPFLDVLFVKLPNQ